MRDLRARRNMRLVFQKAGFYLGGVQAALMSVTGGAFPGGRIRSEPDAEVPRRVGAAEPFVPDRKLDLLQARRRLQGRQRHARRRPGPPRRGPRTCPGDVAELYQHMCPAGVYERQGDRLVVNPPNCVDCKATDVIGPRWTPREGGSGPRYRKM